MGLEVYELRTSDASFQSAAGMWEVAAEGDADRNESSDVLNSTVTLTRMVELPEGTTQVMFVAFADRQKPTPLGMKPAGVQTNAVPFNGPRPRPTRPVRPPTCHA